MKNRKTTRSAVFASFTALLLCASMLIATTFAWFTDSVTSSGNIIKSGTLDVEMSWADGTKAVPADDSTDWTDASTGAIFNYDLWEPGYTEVRHIRVANVGTLALKYQLQIKANDVVSALAEAIDVYFLDPAQQIADRAALPAASLVGTLDDVLSGGIAKASGSLGASDDVELTIALKMQEDAGNEYQDLAIGSDFSVTLLATQMTAETDSFDNQYDAESGWDGSVPTAMPETLVVDTANKVISINDTAALVYLNTLVNDPNFSTTYGSKWQYTVELNADVNLMGKPWTPMVLSNFVAFEGNGHTIRNLSVNTSGKAGLFSEINCDDIGITYIRNLNVDGAYVQGGDCVGVIAGYNPQGVMENVTVNNATVIGNKYVGGIYGHGNGAVTGSAVKNSTITIPAGGAKEAGGLVGYLSNDGLATTENKLVANNVVENVVVTAPTIASGLVSQPNSSNIGGAVIEVKDNSLKNVTVITTADKSANLYVSNNVDNKTIVKDNTADGCSIGTEVYGLLLAPSGVGESHGTIYVRSKEALLNLPKLTQNWDELFSDGNGTNYSNYAPQYDYYYDWTWNIVLEADIDFGGATMAPIDLGHRRSFDGQGHTIKNAVIVTDAAVQNEAGLFNAARCGVKNLKLDNIQVTGSNVGNSTAGVLSGSCNAGISNITVTNSSVTGGKYTGGIVGYGYTDVTDCSLTNVTVKGGYKLGGVIGYICSTSPNTGEVTGNTLTDCTVDGIGGGVYAGGKDKYIVGKLVGNYNTDGTCNNNTVTNMTTSATENIGEIEAGKNVTQA